MFGKITTILVFVSFVQSTLGVQDPFDYSEVGPDNPLAYLWNNKNTLVPENRAPCVVRSGNGGQDREGTCMNAAQCRFNRGKAVGRGSCSFWNTCCVYEKTSNQTSDARVTYFVQPSNPRSLPQNQRMYVKLANKNVCQIRIDIISMQLEPAVASIVATPGTNPQSRTCSVDNFFIEPSQVENRIPEICGTNTNQHFYVHLTANQIINSAIILNVQLASTPPTGSAALVEPRWDIKVTQLECPTRQRLFELQHKDNRNQVVDDFNRLAPASCLQYFTETSGTFKSFGFGNAVADSRLNTGQDYAICFKRLANSCGINLEPTTLNLEAIATNVACANEYIYVPEIMPTTLTEEQCEIVAAPNNIYSSTHPGPLYVHFHSPSMRVEATTTQYGFQFNYRNNVPCQ